MPRRCDNVVEVPGEGLLFWFATGQDWACMVPGAQTGGVNVVGCELGCAPCGDDPAVLQSSLGVSSLGLRWARPGAMEPDQTFTIARESRHADGSRRPLVSNTPVRLPKAQTFFQLAPCFNNFGREAFNTGPLGTQDVATICGCGPTVCPPVDEDPVFLFAGLMNSCYVFSGVEWPPRFFICTGIPGGNYGWAPITFPMAPGNVGNVAMARVGRVEHADEVKASQACTSQLLSLCRGNLEPGGPCTTYPDVPGGFYNTGLNSGSRNAWSFCRIDELEPTFVKDPTGPDTYLAEVDAKNAVLAYLKADRDLGGSGLLKFDQLDGSESNNSLDFYDRGWPVISSPEDIPPFETLPRVTTFPGSHLEGSGEPLLAEYVITEAFIQMSIVLHRVESHDPLVGSTPAPSSEETLPLVRIRINVIMGMRVSFSEAGPNVLSRPWADPPDTIPLTIENRPGARFPRVLPANADRIVYIDDEGRTLRPPPLVVWEGHLGFFSDPPTRNRFSRWYEDQVGSTDIAHECCAMNYGLSFPPPVGRPEDPPEEGDTGLIIPAMESHADDAEGERRKIWDGHLTIRFPWEGGCPTP